MDRLISKTGLPLKIPGKGIAIGGTLLCPELDDYDYRKLIGKELIIKDAKLQIFKALIIDVKLLSSIANVKGLYFLIEDKNAEKIKEGHDLYIDI